MIISPQFDCSIYWGWKVYPGRSVWRFFAEQFWRMFHVTRVLITAHVVTQILSPKFLVDLSIKVAGRTFHPCRCLATKAPKRPGFQDFSGFSLKVRIVSIMSKDFPNHSIDGNFQSFGTTNWLIRYIYPTILPQKIPQSDFFVGKQSCGWKISSSGWNLCRARIPNSLPAWQP